MPFVGRVARIAAVGSSWSSDVPTHRPVVGLRLAVRFVEKAVGFGELWQMDADACPGA